MASSAISGLSAGTLALDDLTLVQEAGGANKSTTGQKLFDALAALSVGASGGAGDTTVVFDGTAAYQASLQQVFDSINLLGTLTGTLASGDTLLVHNASAEQVDYSILATEAYDGDSGSTGWIQRGIVYGYNATAQMGEQTGVGGNTGADADRPYRYRTSSAAGTNTTIRINSNPSHWWGHSLQHAVLLNLEQTTKERFFVGLWNHPVHMSTATAGTWNDSGTTHLGLRITGIGFRYSTSAGDTNWQFCSGTNGQFAFYDTGIPPAVGTMQNLEFRLSGTDSVGVFINGTQAIPEITLYGSNIPDNALLMHASGNATLSDSSAKFWGIARFLTAQKFW